MLTPDEKKKSSAGRKPVDAIVMFRMLVLQALHNLSDEQAEYQVGDRFSFTRFLQLGIEDSMSDATTLWLFREKLAKASRTPVFRDGDFRVARPILRETPPFGG